MSGTVVNISIFDPAIPFVLIQAEEPGIDTWHDSILITKKFREKLHHIREQGTSRIRLSSGMTVSVPRIKLGVQVGNIRIDSIDAAVVEEGYHDIILGSNVLDRIFLASKASTETQAGSSNPFAEEARVNVISPWKEDRQSLALQIYSIDPIPALKEVEEFFRRIRQLHNILCIATDGIAKPTIEQLRSIIEEDSRIPYDYSLKLTYVENGSIWINLKSSCQKALSQMAALFVKGADLEIEERASVASEKRGQSASINISEELRDLAIAKKEEERKRLSPENIEFTHSQWRIEVRENMQLFDDLIDQVEASDPKLAHELRALKNEQIAQLINVSLLPIVRRRPQPDNSERILLPPSKRR